MINKVAPVAPKPTPEGAVFAFTWLTYTGSGMLIAAIISGFIDGLLAGAASSSPTPRPSGCAPIR